MQDRQLSVLFTFFAYGGNGGVSSVCPELIEWYNKVAFKARQDSRVSHLASLTLSDTPITMTRNRSVEVARKVGADVLVMVDSDNVPDVLVGYDLTAKPFFESSFDFLFKNYDRGPTVILSPYCGPPPHPTKGGEENVYMFDWADRESVDEDGIRVDLVGFTRKQVIRLGGIQEAAAGPTGLSMWDMRAFDLTKPPYFYYEYKNDGGNCVHCGVPKPGPQTEKASTEDVTATRDISLNGQILLGYNPVYANWDAWSGHWKPKLVCKPKDINCDHISGKFADAVHENRANGEQLRIIEPPQVKFDSATLKAAEKKKYRRVRQTA